jgi:hypothetical protein
LWEDTDPKYRLLLSFAYTVSKWIYAVEMDDDTLVCGLCAAPGSDCKKCPAGYTEGYAVQCGGKERLYEAYGINPTKENAQKVLDFALKLYKEEYNKVMGA